MNDVGDNLSLSLSKLCDVIRFLVRIYLRNVVKVPRGFTFILHPPNKQNIQIPYIKQLKQKKSDKDGKKEP